MDDDTRRPRPRGGTADGGGGNLDRGGANTRVAAQASAAQSDGRFYCPHPGCRRSFVDLWRLRVHHRADPDSRGSGKERGHGAELPFCPKCRATIYEGRKHMNCRPPSDDRIGTSSRSVFDGSASGGQSDAQHEQTPSPMGRFQRSKHAASEHAGGSVSRDPAFSFQQPQRRQPGRVQVSPETFQPRRFSSEEAGPSTMPCPTERVMPPYYGRPSSTSVLHSEAPQYPPTATRLRGGTSRAAGQLLEQSLPEVSDRRRVPGQAHIDNYQRMSDLAMAMYDELAARDAYMWRLAAELPDHVRAAPRGEDDPVPPVPSHHYAVGRTQNLWRTPSGGATTAASIPSRLSPDRHPRTTSWPPPPSGYWGAPPLRGIDGYSAWAVRQHTAEYAAQQAARAFTARRHRHSTMSSSSGDAGRFALEDDAARPDVELYPRQHGPLRSPGEGSRPIRRTDYHPYARPQAVLRPGIDRDTRRASFLPDHYLEDAFTPPQRLIPQHRSSSGLTDPRPPHDDPKPRD